MIQQTGGAAAGPAFVQRFENKSYYRYSTLTGKAVHSQVEERLRSANRARGLITEAPIPGGTTDTAFVPGATREEEVGEKSADYFNEVGRADLYTSSTSTNGEAPGVRGILGKERDKDDPKARSRRYWNFTHAATAASTGPVNFQPRTQGGKKAFIGGFPENFQVADLKPLGMMKMGEGVAQIGNYILGFQNFVQQAAADGKIAPGTPGSTTGSRLTGLTIPDGIRYDEGVDQEMARPTPSQGSLIGGPGRNTRYWIHEVPNLGLYVYFHLKHPSPHDGSGQDPEGARSARAPATTSAKHSRSGRRRHPLPKSQAARVRSPRAGASGAAQRATSKRLELGEAEVGKGTLGVGPASRETIPRL